MLWTTTNIVEGPKVQGIMKLDYEVSLALYVRPDNIIASTSVDKKGTARGVELPDIAAVEHGCRVHRTNKVILVHNHPYLNGGCDSTPSEEDLKATFGFKNLLAERGIELLDHIIVGQDESFFSFRNMGLLGEESQNASLWSRLKKWFKGV